MHLLSPGTTWWMGILYDNWKYWVNQLDNWKLAIVQIPIGSADKYFLQNGLYEANFLSSPFHLEDLFCYIVTVCYDGRGVKYVIRRVNNRPFSIITKAKWLRCLSPNQIVVILCSFHYPFFFSEGKINKYPHFFTDGWV